MKSSALLLLLLASAQLCGCASNPQLPVSFADNALTAQSGRFGVAMTALPKVDTSFPGAGCLLCLATTATANSSLTKHTHMLTAEDLLTLKDGIADRLRKKGVDVTVIAENLNVRQLKDFSGGGRHIRQRQVLALAHTPRDRAQLPADVAGGDCRHCGRSRVFG